MTKQKKCKGCGEPIEFTLRNGIRVYNQSQGYGKKCCYNNWLISDDPKAKETFEKFLIKAKDNFHNAIKLNNKIKKKVLKDKLKTLSQYESDAKKEFQKFIRLRDADLPCISCGATDTVFHGGHFYKAEIYSGLIFDERNCSKQCAKCNTYLGGNENNYRLGLIQRKGVPFVLQLDADAIKLRDYKYTKQELIDIKNHYKKLNKEFETKL